MSHHAFMHRCLELGSKGRGLVGNGAMVGSLLAREGRVLAEAFHEGFGQLHAERSLLENAEQHMFADATLYVNLEPCAHRGKTPPCTDIIIDRGIKRVVVGSMDPDSRVRGRGVEQLRAGGVEVIGPVERAFCERLNRGFMTVRTKQRPWITLKKAQTRSGHIANPDGSRLKITTPEQDRQSHIHERAQTDAILVGVETVLRDDPQLTVRLGDSSWQPWRIILDPSSRISPNAKVLTDSLSDRTIVVSSLNNYSDQNFAYEEGLYRKLNIKYTGGMFEWHSLWSALTTPQANFPGITTLLVEGGQRTWERFRQGGFVDEEVILVGM